MFNLCQSSDTKVVLRSLNKTTDVPYCDSFAVEEEWWLMSLPGTKCCAFRLTMGIIWYKSTMMKSIITSNTVAESAKSWNLFKEYVLVQHGCQFKE